MGLYSLLDLVYLDPIVEAWVAKWCRKPLEQYVIIIAAVGLACANPQHPNYFELL